MSLSQETFIRLLKIYILKICSTHTKQISAMSTCCENMSGTEEIVYKFILNLAA